MRAAFCLLTTLLMQAGCKEQPQRYVSATVTDIAPRVSRWKGDRLLITARSHDGLVGSMLIDAVRLRCRVGDRVKARERGVALSLDKQACQR